MRVLSEAAYVLHARPFRETSLIIEIFSRHYGRCGLLARGARNPKSAKRALIMPFQPLLLNWQGKGDLPLLTGIEATGAARDLKFDQRFAAYYINELLLKLLHRHDAHEELFDYYGSILDDLYAGKPVQQALRRFEKTILGMTGYALILDREAETASPISRDKHYQYIAEYGPVSVADQPGAAQDRSRGCLIRGKSLLDYHLEDFRDRKTLVECRRLVRYLIEQQLSGGSLNSRRVFHQVLSSLS